MNCEEANGLIEAFHDGELSFSLKNHLEAHLTHCRSCRAAYDTVSELDHLLEKSFTPTASTALDQKVMHALGQKRSRNLKSKSWWKRVFLGSISVPKPIFAGAAILILAGFIAGNIFVRNDSLSNNIVGDAPKALNATAVNSTPQITVETKVIEVPVIQERIVTRVVYVEKENQSQSKSSKLLKTVQRNGQIQSARAQPTKKDELTMSGTVAENGYFTKVNLAGFQPANEMKARIIREVKTDEK